MMDGFQMTSTHRLLIHHTYDVFAKCERNRIVDTKLVLRQDHRKLSPVIVDDDGSVTRWLHPDDNEFVYAGSIAAPLAWVSEKPTTRLRLQRVAEIRITDENRARHDALWGNDDE